MPQKTPLNPRLVGTLARDGYRIERVIFESRPSHHVTANLYLPGGKGPFPGVLLPCGHSDNGKAYESYQRASILLAKNGMAVLCYDPIGQGERNQRLDAQGKPVIRGTTEHTMAGIGALLVGRQLASYRIWDGLRALDYLASRPEIDPRLGVYRQLGGGHHDGVSHGIGRPDRGRGTFVLHHFTGRAFTPRLALKTPSRTSPDRSPPGWSTPIT